MLYHKTKDPYYGDSCNDEFTVKVASDPEEIKALLEVGFEYVCEKDGLLFFRKRKKRNVKKSPRLFQN